MRSVFNFPNTSMLVLQHNSDMIRQVSNKHQAGVSPKNTNAKSRKRKSIVKKYPREDFCRYSFYSCGRKRAVKLDGELHTLCEKHRADANRNQRQLAKRRQQKRSMLKLANQYDVQNINSMSPLSNAFGAWNFVSDVPIQPTSSNLSPFFTQNQLLNFDYNLMQNQYQSLFQGPNIATYQSARIDNQMSNGYEFYEPSIEPLQLEDEDINLLEQVLGTDSPSPTITNL